jgi:hypothetical protein
MGARDGVAMDSLKHHLGPTMLRPTTSTTYGGANPETALWPSHGRPACGQQAAGSLRRAACGGQPAAVFSPFGLPTPYAYGSADRRRKTNASHLRVTSRGVR